MQPQSTAPNEPQAPPPADSLDPAISQAAAWLGRRGGAARIRHPQRTELARRAGLASAASAKHHVRKKHKPNNTPP